MHARVMEMIELLAETASPSSPVVSLVSMAVQGLLSVGLAIFFVHRMDNLHEENRKEKAKLEQFIREDLMKQTSALSEELALNRTALDRCTAVMSTAELTIKETCDALTWFKTHAEKP